MRPTIEQTLMAIADLWSARSSCPRGQAGCVISDGWGRVIASGYNGAPYGLAHCEDVGCLMEGGIVCPQCQGSGTHPYKAVQSRPDVPCSKCLGSGKIGGHCVRSMHAEINALLWARQDVSGHTVHCTLRPCVRCALALIQARVGYVVYRDDYGSDELKTVESLFEEAEIPFRRIL